MQFYSFAVVLLFRSSPTEAVTLRMPLCCRYPIFRITSSAAYLKSCKLRLFDDQNVTFATTYALILRLLGSGRCFQRATACNQFLFFSWRKQATLDAKFATFW